MGSPRPPCACSDWSCHPRKTLNLLHVCAPYASPYDAAAHSVAHKCALERRHNEDQSACSTRAFISAVGSSARPGRRIECSPLRPLVMTPRGRTRAGRIGAERIAPSPYRVLKASAACRGSLLLMMECALLFTHDKLFAWACSTPQRDLALRRPHLPLAVCVEHRGRAAAQRRHAGVRNPRRGSRGPDGHDCYVCVNVIAERAWTT